MEMLRSVKSEYLPSLTDLQVNLTHSKHLQLIADKCVNLQKLTIKIRLYRIGFCSLFEPCLLGLKNLTDFSIFEFKLPNSCLESFSNLVCLTSLELTGVTFESQLSLHSLVQALSMTPIQNFVLMLYSVCVDDVKAILGELRLSWLEIGVACVTDLEFKEIGSFISSSGSHRPKSFFISKVGVSNPSLVNINGTS